MEKQMEQQKRVIRSQRGITLMELLVVLVILSLLGVLAVPTFAAWREDSECREVARSIFFLLRQARSNAVAANREHRVEFEAASGRYGIRIGDKSTNTLWTSVPPVKDWVTCGSQVHFQANVKSIHFNTNGTANGGTITVSDDAMVKKFDIVINHTGRIRVQRPGA